MTLRSVSLFSTADMVSQFAQNEQNMNAVERILAYIDLPSEADTTTVNDPAPSWPERGEIEFKHVDLAYRKGLPLVLRDVTFSIREGEKVRKIAYFLCLLAEIETSHERLVLWAEQAQVGLWDVRYLHCFR